jgi:hypothetical protein
VPAKAFIDFHERGIKARNKPARKRPAREGTSSARSRSKTRPRSRVSAASA